MILLPNTYSEARNECSQLKEWTNYYMQKLSLIENLADMGFGFKELKLLWYTIAEISDANNISREDSAKRFFKEIEEYYDDILGLESRNQKLEVEVDDLGQRKLNLSAVISVLTKPGGPFAKLIDIAANNSPEEVILLADKVHMVGGIKTAMEELSAQPTLATDSKTPFLSNSDSKNDIADGQPEKNTTIKLAHVSMVYQHNISSADQSNNDKTTVLPVNNYSQDDNRANNVGKEKAK